MKQRNVYDRCLVQVCLQNNNNYYDSLCSNLNKNDKKYIDSHCQNDSFSKCLNIFKSNNKYNKILNFNAQGLLEAEHFEHIIN